MAQFDFAVVTTGEFRGWLVSGFLLSLRLTAITWVLSVPIATAIALCRLSSVTALRWFGVVFVEGVRNVPLLVHFLFWYFAMPELLPEALRNWLYEHDAETVCAVIALTFYTTSFMAEDIRSGIRAVPVTQLEAARALGFNFLASMRRIVLTAGGADRRTSSHLPDPEFVEEHEHRHGDRYRGAHVPGAES